MAKQSPAKNKRPTMYDVAKLAGVSQPTVSRVLNENDTAVTISEDTRTRVMAAIEELGYRPNVLARSLRTQRTQTIALMIADLSNGFYHPIARAVQDVARVHDYEVLISNSDHVYENEKHFCQVVSRRPVDGAIIVPIHLTEQDIRQYFGKSNTPVSMLGSHLHLENVDVVYVDDERATYEAVRWMITERGYHDFGFIGVSDDLPPGPRRFNGFRRALDEFGLTFDPRFYVEGDFTMEGGAAAARTLMRSGTLPRALFACNDLMAIGAILTFQEAGVQIPDQVAVMGFDDIPEARIIRPMLTTIAQDPRDIGLKLANALFERLESPTPIPTRVFESERRLVVRDSA
ncbi:MAG: LacI family DNA-binding transcriptional regulator [Anaerolineae bacterium]